MIWALIRSNKLTILIGVATFLLGLNIGFNFGHWIGVDDGLDKAQNKVNEKALDISEKRNEIRNNRPDTNAFFNGLLQDDNW